MSVILLRDLIFLLYFAIKLNGLQIILELSIDLNLLGYLVFPARAVSPVLHRPFYPINDVRNRPRSVQQLTVVRTSRMLQYIH